MTKVWIVLSGGKDDIDIDIDSVWGTADAADLRVKEIKQDKTKWAAVKRFPVT